MKIKAIIFDTDGMIVNCEMFSKQFAKAYNLPYGEVVLPFFINEFQQCIIGKADLKKEVVKYFRQWKWKNSTEDFLRFWFESEHHLNEKLIEYIYLLRNKGVKCYLATNQEKYRKEYMLNEMDFQNIFDDVFFSCDLQTKKPTPNFFKKMIKLLGSLKKDEVLFWDDQEKNVKEASNFGFYAERYVGFEDFLKKMENFYKFNHV